MPDRIIRDWTDSEHINSLSWQAEVFFVRLIMKADDYGRFHGNPRLLKSLLFPLKDGLRDADISRWIAECEKSGLIRTYTDKISQKPFIQIAKFNQRLRTKKAKFPDENGILSTELCQQSADKCPQPAGNCPQPAGKCPPEVEDEGENEGENKERTLSRSKEKALPSSLPRAPGEPIHYSEWSEGRFREEVSKYPEFAYIADRFIDYWIAPAKQKGKMLFQTEKSWSTKSRLQTWQSRCKDGEIPKYKPDDGKDDFAMEEE